MTHAIDIEQPASAVSAVSPLLWYRWRCCCGQVGAWRKASKPGGAVRAARSARDGGRKHVAVMERG